MLGHRGELHHKSMQFQSAKIIRKMVRKNIPNGLLLIDNHQQKTWHLQQGKGTYLEHCLVNALIMSHG